MKIKQISKLWVGITLGCGLCTTPTFLLPVLLTPIPSQAQDFTLEEPAPAEFEDIAEGYGEVLAAPGDVFKANNKGALSLGSSWVGGMVPGVNNVAVWDSRLTALNCTNMPGGNLSWAGIRIVNPAVPSLINSSTPVYTLTLGAAGIDLGSEGNTQEFRIKCHLVLSSPQTWNIPAGCILSLGNNRASPPSVHIKRDLVLAGSGVFQYGRSVDIMNGSTLYIGPGMTVETMMFDVSVIRVGITNGTGTINQTGGTVRLGRSSNSSTKNLLNIGQTAGETQPSGVYNLSGGMIEDVGDDPASCISIGTGAGASGVMNVSGTGQAWAKTIYVGHNGAGTLNIFPGGLVVASHSFQLPWTATGSGTNNLNGGRLIIPGIRKALSATSICNFNGGILEASADNTSFILAETVANVLHRGAVFDTAGFNIGIETPLLHESGADPDGGVTKTGAGTLTLEGANSYTGPTYINEGKLVVSALSTGGGEITVLDGATLAVNLSAMGTSLSIASLRLGAGDNTSLEFRLETPGIPTAPFILASNVTVNGACVVTFNAGTVGRFPLIGYTETMGGAGSFALGWLPRGVTATLETNFTSSTLDLVVSEIVPVIWTGAIDSTWDINGTRNWQFFNAPTVYLQPSPPGDSVYFDDNAVPTSTDVVLAYNLSPSGIIVSNSVLNYSFNGPGMIIGNAGLQKLGAGVLSINTPNEYSGDTVIWDGTLLLGADNILPSGSAKGDLVLQGTLNLRGHETALNGLFGNGTIVNSGLENVTLTLGGDNAGGNFAGVIGSSAGRIYLVKQGQGVLTLSGSNTYSGGTTLSNGTLRAGSDQALGVGPVEVHVAQICSEGTSARVLSNNMFFRGAVRLGDTVNNGKLTFSGGVDLTGASRAITTLSDVVWAGISTNGGLHKYGAGTLRSTGIGQYSKECEVRGGTFILDGGTVHALGTFRVDCDADYDFARLVLTNGATLELSGTNRNLRVGWNGAGQTNYFDLSGILRFQTYGNNCEYIHLAADRHAEFTLLPGGEVETRGFGITNSPVGTTILNLNGGLLRALIDTEEFIDRLNFAYVREKGAFIDSGGHRVGISLSLLDGGGHGALTKLGDGALLLNGANTYTGPTIVSSGTLGGTGVVQGTVWVKPGSTLAPGDSIGRLTLNTPPILNGLLLMELNRDSNPECDRLAVTGPLTYSGALEVQNLGGELQAGDHFTLFSARSYDGAFASVVLPPLGPGLVWDTSRLTIIGSISVANRPRVEMQLVQADLANVLAEIIKAQAIPIPPSSSSVPDHLGRALEHINQALSMAWWVDDTHLVPKEGHHMFEELRGAVLQITEALNHKEGGLPVAILEDLVHRMVNTARLLAVIELNEAAVAQANQKKLEEDWKELGKGDAMNSEGKWEQAIEHYGHAWQHAAHLVVKLTWGPGNAYGFDFLGFPGTTYQIQASTNLIEWKTLGQVTAGANGVVGFSDPEAAGASRRFYRVLPK